MFLSFVEMAVVFIFFAIQQVLPSEKISCLALIYFSLELDSMTIRWSYVVRPISTIGHCLETGFQKYSIVRCNLHLVNAFPI